MVDFKAFVAPAGAIAAVSIIDTGARLRGLSCNMLLAPEVSGFKFMPDTASYSFLITSSAGKRVLFDLGLPINVGCCAPLVASQLESANASIIGDRSVADVLKSNSVSLDEIESVIWSHHHWDHLGDIREFPGSTKIVVGPGFSETYLPGYPRVADSHLIEAYFQGRAIREITFPAADVLKIGPFRAHDFFGDGSFYLLDTFGHSTGHLAGLVRTTSGPDTFLFLGADLSHHSGELRPSHSLPIPDAVESYPSRTSTDHCPCLSSRLSGRDFRRLHGKQGREPGEAFFDPVLAEDIDAAKQTIRGAQLLDGDDRVLTILSHDMTIHGTIDLFPKSANAWREKGWKEATRWGFLADLAVGASEARDEARGSAKQTAD